MGLPLWVVWVAWVGGLIVLGRRRGALRGPGTAARLVTALGLFGVGLVVMAVGLFLEIELCLGSGSECRGVEPIWSPGGAVLAYVGFGMCFVGPVFPLVWCRRGRVSPPTDRLPRNPAS
jgi:hypothetical protein